MKKLRNLRGQSSEYYRVLVLRTIGNFLILSSLFMMAKTFAPPLGQEIRYAIESYYKKEYVVQTDTAVPETTRAEDRRGTLARLMTGRRVEVLQPKDTNFSIIIPKVGANANIVANVNAANEEEYLDALKYGVAHTLGTAFPGEGGHIYLFAHSTDYFWNVGSYNAVFYLIYKLEPGDEINLFYQGQRYVYNVIGKQEVGPEEVQYLTRKSNTEFLTLQTCWPPGTTLRRMLVFATRVSE